MDIGKRLRELRTARGLSQFVIAERTGILRCNIWRIEKGRFIPSLRTLGILARALEVNLYEFFLEGDKEQRASGVRKLSLLGAERRMQFETLKKLNEMDRRLLLGLAQKMASKNRPAG